MGLWSQKQLEQITATAVKVEKIETVKVVKSDSITRDLENISQAVLDYFKGSPAILITTKEQLHDYVSQMIEVGIGGLDTETTGLDRQLDHVVGASLYYPGGVECYIPSKHILPVFNTLYPNQLSYEVVAAEFQRFTDAKTKLIFANADFDLAMTYNSYGIDLSPAFYYDAQLAWRCIKEDEKDNALKVLYNKYVLKGEGDPKKFSDFFTPSLFPYSKPEVAKLYAAHDAKITYELYAWQLPWITKDHPKCKKVSLEKISDLIWNLEMPLVPAIQNLHRRGVFIDQEVASKLVKKYDGIYQTAMTKLRKMVQDVLDNPKYTPPIGAKRAFLTASEFNPNSPPQVSYLLYTCMKQEGKGTDKAILGAFHLPVADQILEVRHLAVLINTFVQKLPKLAKNTKNVIHGTFKQIGADTGRMSSTDPNLQNIPSHVTDIRHMFRARPGYAMLSSDFSAQEPRIAGFLAQDETMIQTFREGRDIYAGIAEKAFNVPYDQCKEFGPNGEYQPEGKKRRSNIKSVLLGVLYGRTIQTIADQLYGDAPDLTDEQKYKKGEQVYNAVLFACPGLRNLMNYSQRFAQKYGYVETVLGRRRHVPDMMLPKFEFTPMKGYINPDVDPMDISTLQNANGIPERIQESILKELMSYRYYGQVYNRIRSLADDGIRVVNHSSKIADAERQCVNSRVQGSAADMTKMAMLLIEKNARWKEIGAQIILPVHDELIAEAPLDHAEEAGKLLAKLMEESAAFLQFPIKCDVTTTYRWYGLEIESFDNWKKPESFSDMLTEDEVKWVQGCLFETGYDLPVIKVDGRTPGGDAANGINGQVTPEYTAAIIDYIGRCHITEDEFVDHIWNKVRYYQ